MKGKICGGGFTGWSTSTSRKGGGIVSEKKRIRYIERGGGKIILKKYNSNRGGK